MPAASQAGIGYNSVFYIGSSASPIVYTAISETAEINPSDYTVTEIDVTHLQSPNVTEESIPGMIKPGTVEVMGNYIGDASQQQIDTLALARTIFPWKYTSPLGTGQTLTVTGRGYINKKQLGPFGPNKKTDFHFGIKMAGTLVYLIA